MKVASVVVTLLAGVGLSAASRCRPSPPLSGSSSASSIAPSSVSSASSSAAPSSSPVPSGSTCGPEDTLVPTETDISASSKWIIDEDPFSFYVTPGTCNGGPTNNCIRFSGHDANSNIRTNFQYTGVESLTVGAYYTWEFQFSQDMPSPAGSADYTVFTSFAAGSSGTSASAEFQFTQAANTWQTVSFNFLATDSATILNVQNTVSGSLGVGFANFKLYKTCPLQ